MQITTKCFATNKHSHVLGALVLCGLLSACAGNEPVAQQVSLQELESEEMRKAHELISAGSADIRLLSSWPDQVQETSGLAQGLGYWWTINDSGDEPVLYGLDQTHKIRKRITVEGAENIDWESLAQDDEALYIADCGNNAGLRPVFQIYKVYWRDLARVADQDRVPAKTIQFSYADMPLPPLGKAHNFDCEALTVVGKELWLFTKNRGDQKTRLYRLDRDKPQQTPVVDQQLPVAGLITAADYDSGANLLVLLGYGKHRIFGESFLWLLPLGVGHKVDFSQARRLQVHPYAQWEAIAWDREGEALRLLLTAEKSLLLDVSFGELQLVPK